MTEKTNSTTKAVPHTVKRLKESREWKKGLLVGLLIKRNGAGGGGGGGGGQGDLKVRVFFIMIEQSHTIHTLFVDIDICAILLT